MPKLKRALGLFDTSLYGIGLILGAGIYALIGKAAGIAGNSLWASFVFAAFIAALTALSYCELSAIFPKAGAEYVYAQGAFKRYWLSFAVAWMFIFTVTFSSAAVALGFGGYFSSLVSPFINFPVIFGAIILVVVMSFINLYGIEQSSKLNIIFTVLEMFGLVFIIALGIGHLGSVNYLELPPGGIGSVFTAAALIFFAYVGFEDIANIAEETKKPEKTLPRAIVISVVVTTILYVLVALSSISILDWRVLGASNAPLADVAESALPGSLSLLGIIALFSTGNTVLILLITVSRMLYGMARSGALPKFLSTVSEKRRTPWVAGMVSMALVLLFAMIGDIKKVAEISNFSILSVFVVVNASLIRLRYSKPYIVRPFKVPLNIGKFPVLPFLGIIFSLFLMSRFDPVTILAGIGIFVLGLVFFKILEYREEFRFRKSF